MWLKGPQGGDKTKKENIPVPDLISSFVGSAPSLVEVGQSFCDRSRGKGKRKVPLLAINHRKEKEKGAKDLLKLENLLYFLFFRGFRCSFEDREVQGGCHSNF